MIITISILSVAFLFTSFTTYFFIKKYKKLTNELSIVISDVEKHNRHGYYKMKCLQGTINFEPIVFVTEIDRYTNGESKLKLDKIEISCGNNNFNSESAKKFVENEFESLVLSSKIIWLDSEVEIKELRKEKLQRLKNIKV